MTIEMPVPTSEQLQEILRRTIELLNNKLDPKQIRQMASAFPTVCWNFTDNNVTIFLVFDNAEPSIQFAASIEGDSKMVIDMESKTLNDTAWGRSSFGTAFITGKLKIKGLHPLKFTKFVPLLEPFLASYREAQEEYYGQQK